MRKEQSYYLYWIHRNAQKDLLSEGYIGITNDIDRRFKTHKYKAENGSKLHVHLAIQKYDDIKFDILCVGDKEYIIELEEKLRPSSNIGWNITKGGNLPKEVTEQMRVGWVTAANKSCMVSRFKVIKMMIDYHINGLNFRDIER